MNQTLNPMSTPRVSDLVLSPFDYSDSLRGQMLYGGIAGDEAEHLYMALPVAIAQLDILGDSYGALALASLYEQLESLHLVA